MLFSVKSKVEDAMGLVSDYGGWFYDLWDKNKVSKGGPINYPRDSFYKLVGKGIGLRG